MTRTLPLGAAEFRAIAAACDALLREPGAPPAWIATQWLHVLSHHPAVVERYADLITALREGTVPGGRPDPSGFAATAAMLARSLAAPRQELPAGPIGALLISRVGRPADLAADGDLMFGDLPQRLAQRGVRSLTLLRNHTGKRYGELARHAHRSGPEARALLPDVRPVTAEARAVVAIRRARRLMRSRAISASGRADAIVAGFAAREMRAAVVAEGIRLHAQVAEACRRSRPGVLLITYEGHAWEKCAAAGAWSVDPSITVIAYQHTLMWPFSHAPLRRIRRERAFDPDLVLTSGEVTREWLAGSAALRPTEVAVLGSYRRPTRIAGRPSERDDVIVLPDGFHAETLALFRVAIDAARAMPSVRWILRPHPVVPFGMVRADLGEVPANVEVSAVRELDADLARAGAVVYRGSSTVMTAVLAGLKPYYLEIPGEMTIDLLAEVDGWRERVRDGRALAERHERHRTSGRSRAVADWTATRAYCERSLMPIDDAEVERIASLALARSSTGSRRTMAT